MNESRNRSTIRFINQLRPNQQHTHPSSRRPTPDNTPDTSPLYKSTPWLSARNRATCIARFYPHDTAHNGTMTDSHPWVEGVSHTDIAGVSIGAEKVCDRDIECRCDIEEPLVQKTAPTVLYIDQHVAGDT